MTRHIIVTLRRHFHFRLQSGRYAPQSSFWTGISRRAGKRYQAHKHFATPLSCRAGCAQDLWPGGGGLKCCDLVGASAVLSIIERRRAVWFLIVTRRRLAIIGERSWPAGPRWSPPRESCHTIVSTRQVRSQDLVNRLHAGR